MKTFYPLIILAFIFLDQSCKDKKKRFQPSLNLEEYVLITTNGVERIFTVDNDINVKHSNTTAGSREINLGFWPELNTFTNFSLKIENPEIGDMKDNIIRFNYSDYALDNSFTPIFVNCFEGCPINMEMEIHEYGEEIGSRYVAEFSGSFPEENGNPIINFEAEFVVLIDE